MRPVIDEIEFESAFGKLVAKTWNEETPDCKRYLAIHGWMDNAGSFDNFLKELLQSEDHYVVALDLPGHGKSSRAPPGLSYNDSMMVREIRRFLLHLGWVQPIIDLKSDSEPEAFLASSNSSDNIQALVDNSSDTDPRFTLIGHSYGGYLAMCYASLFPLGVETLIVLDFIKTKTLSLEEVLRNEAESMDRFIALQKNKSDEKKHESCNTFNTQVVVTQESAIAATIEAHRDLGFLSRDDTLCLLKRSTVPVNVPANSLIYYRDRRLKLVQQMRDHLEINKILFCGIRCNVFFIMAKEGIYTRPSFSNHFGTIEEFIKSRAKSFVLDWIEGDHFFHINQAKQAAHMVARYLKIEEID